MRPSSRWPKRPFSQAFYFAVASVLALMGFCFCAVADVSHVIQYAPNPSYDNIPITPKTWEEVDFFYYSTISGHRYTNAIQLLRPIAWLHKRHMDIIGSKVTLSIPEFGIVNVLATVKGIKPTQIDTRGVDWSKQNSAPVIGKFMRYVTDVRTYTFKDSLGHISHINATPNHPFYVKNKHGFVAIGNVSDDDTLVGTVGFGNKHMNDSVHLVCTKGKHGHCGVHFMGTGLPAPVYNLEAYRRHVYLVGGGAVLVHNGCIDPISLDDIGDDDGYRFIGDLNSVTGSEVSRYHKDTIVNYLRGKKISEIIDPTTRVQTIGLQNRPGRTLYYGSADFNAEFPELSISNYVMVLGEKIKIPIGFKAKGIAYYPNIVVHAIYGVLTLTKLGKFSSREFLVLRSNISKKAYTLSGNFLGDLKLGKKQAYQYISRLPNDASFLEFS